MKKILNLASMLLVAVILGSCSKEYEIGDGRPRDARGLMMVEVLARGASADDYVRTARFIVFDYASAFPSLDINKIIQLNSEEQDATKFRTTLEVNCNSDKMIVVILNEPEATTTALDNVVFPGELEEMTFLMADAFNTNCTAPASTGLPMTGAKKGVSVTRANDSEANAATVEVSVERAVARVELWLKTDGVTTAEVTDSTSISLSKSHDRGYLVGPNATDDFGRMMTAATPAKEVTWTYTGPASLQLTGTEQLVCAFYTPERTCSAPDNADKLILHIQNVNSSVGIKNAETVLARFSSGGSSLQTITEIRRNHIYKVIGRITEMTFDNMIVPWTEAYQGVIIDPQYYLRVSDDDLYMSEMEEEVIVTVETNYDRSDRGFMPGIQMSEMTYYDAAGQQITDTTSNIYGWVIAAPLGESGDLERSIKFIVDKPSVAGGEDCYATMEVRAGNLIKIIKVTRR